MEASVHAKQAELALAAYANLQPGVPNQTALQDQGKGMSARQAEEFAASYTVLAQFNDTAEKTKGTGVELISLS